MIIFRAKIFINSLLNHESLSYQNNLFMPLGISTQSVNREHSPFKSPAQYSVIDLWPLLDDLKKNHHTQAEAMLASSFYTCDRAWHQYPCRPIPGRPGVSVMAEFDLKVPHKPSQSSHYVLFQSETLSTPVFLIGFTFSLQSEGSSYFFWFLLLYHL